jgi:hypothetical protein
MLASIWTGKRSLTGKRELNMTRTYIRALAIGAMLATSIVSVAQGAEKCTTATLKGDYGGLLTGTIIGLGPIALVTTVTFDGAGGWSYDETGSVNGNSIPNQHFTGNYIVNAKCGGSTTDSGGNSTDFVIVGSGKDIQVMMAGTGSGAVFTVVLRKRLGSDE